MKTQFDLWRKYCTETVPMAEAAGIDPWLCVRYPHGTYGNHPLFTSPPDTYTFALTVLEKTPVFPGMAIYSKLSTDTYSVCEGITIDWGNWTLTPPTKKRTFMLELTEEEVKAMVFVPLSVQSKLIKLLGQE